MTLVNFADLDFDQVKTSITNYLRANSDFTDYDFEGSNLSTIIDVLAYNTYITSYNANMVANEVFIDSATLRENVISLARNIGYVPRSRKAARSTISFFVDTSDFSIKPRTLTLKAGVVGITRSFGRESYSFSVPEDITVTVNNDIAEFNNIVVYEGTLISQNFTVDATIPNQRFLLDNVGIDSSLLTVNVATNENSSVSRNYTLANSLFDINGESAVYFLQEIADEKDEFDFIIRGDYDRVEEYAMKIEEDEKIVLHSLKGPAIKRWYDDGYNDEPHQEYYIRGKKMKKIALATAFAMAATSAFAGNPAPATTEAPVVPAPEAAASASGWVLPALLLIAIAAAANKK